jgi:hypothetical protein
MSPVDDLKEISIQAIDDGVISTACVIIFLNDETLNVSYIVDYSIVFISSDTQSKWCIREWEVARDHSVPILCVVDIERWHVRRLVKDYIEAG